MSPDTLNLFYAPKDRLRLTVGDEKSYPTVVPAWAAPLSHPRKFLALQDAKGNEIVMLDSPDQLTESSRACVLEELHRRYLSSTVLRIIAAKVEFGSTYWTLLTERGERECVTQSLQENAQWLGENHLLLIDVDGNRFEITDTEALDSKSREFLAAIL